MDHNIAALSHTETHNTSLERSKPCLLIQSLFKSLAALLLCFVTIQNTLISIVLIIRGAVFVGPICMMIKSSLFESHKPCILAHNSKNSIIPLLTAFRTSWKVPIYYIKGNLMILNLTPKYVFICFSDPIFMCTAKIQFFHCSHELGGFICNYSLLPWSHHWRSTGKS